MQMEVINKRNVLILQKVFQCRGWNRKQGDNIDEKVNVRFVVHIFFPLPPLGASIIFTNFIYTFSNEEFGFINFFLFQNNSNIQNFLLHNCICIQFYLRDRNDNSIK